MNQDNWAKVVVHLDVNIGDADIDDDFWMDSLLDDLKDDLSGHQWYVSSTYLMGEYEASIAEEVNNRKDST